jgi:hypothetical protein
LEALLRRFFETAPHHTIERSVGERRRIGFQNGLMVSIRLAAWKARAPPNIS